MVAIVTYKSASVIPLLPVEPDERYIVRSVIYPDDVAVNVWARGPYQLFTLPPVFTNRELILLVIMSAIATDAQLKAAKASRHVCARHVVNLNDRALNFIVAPKSGERANLRELPVALDKASSAPRYGEYVETMSNQRPSPFPHGAQELEMVICKLSRRKTSLSPITRMTYKPS